MWTRRDLTGALKVAQRWLGFSELPNTAEHGLNGFGYLCNCAQHGIPHGISIKRLMHDCKHLQQLPIATAAASSAQQHTLPALSTRPGKQAGHQTPLSVAAQRQFMRQRHFASSGSDNPADRLHLRERGSQLGQQNQLYSSSAAVEAAAKPSVPPQAGTVALYNHHVLVRVLPPEDQPSQSDAIWWPAIMERHPALVQAFAAVAAEKPHIDGVVKITAFESVERTRTQKRRDKDKVDLMIFPAGVKFSKLPLERVKEVVAYHVAEHDPERPEVEAQPDLGSKVKEEEFKGLALFVCTHTSRDCRCGTIGTALARRLQTLVEEQGLDLIHVYQVSHVGGHKYAGNVLVYGSMSTCDGDWYGGLDKGNAEAFLDALVGTEVGIDGGAEDPQLRKWWRGRMGLSREEQLELFANAEGIPMARLSNQEGDELSDGNTSNDSSSESESISDSSSDSDGEGGQEPVKAAKSAALRQTSGIVS